MRAVLQRAVSASVTIEGHEVARIGAGAVVLLGVGQDDGVGDVEMMVGKLADLRVCADEHGRMNRSLVDVGGSVLLVSQFTLFGDVRRGRRPSFTDAAAPDIAKHLYEAVAEGLRGRGLTVATGVFQADMHVALVNDGPVTILIDTRKVF